MIEDLTFWHHGRRATIQGESIEKIAKESGRLFGMPEPGGKDGVKEWQILLLDLTDGELWFASLEKRMRLESLHHLDQRGGSCIIDTLDKPISAHELADLLKGRLREIENAEQRLRMAEMRRQLFDMGDYIGHTLSIRDSDIEAISQASKALPMGSGWLRITMNAKTGRISHTTKYGEHERYRGNGKRAHITDLERPISHQGMLGIAREQMKALAENRDAQPFHERAQELFRMHNEKGAREWEFDNGILVREDFINLPDIPELSCLRFSVHDLDGSLLGTIEPTDNMDFLGCVLELDAGNDPISWGWDDGHGNRCAWGGWGKAAE